MDHALSVELRASSGDARAYDLLRGTVGLFAQLFPSRLRAVYLQGSDVDATSLATSDLDLTLVFKKRFRVGEAALAHQALAACAAFASVEYDAVDEEALGYGAWPLLKLGGALV